MTTPRWRVTFRKDNYINGWYTRTHHHHDWTGIVDDIDYIVRNYGRDVRVTIVREGLHQ